MVLFRFFWINLAFIYCSYNASAQSIGFIPSKILVSTYEISDRQINKAYQSGSEKESILSKSLWQRSIPKDAISGSIRYRESNHILKLQYGLVSTVNMGISIPYVSRKRISELSVNNSTYSSFAREYSDAEAAGLGDLEIWSVWQVIYNDDLNLIFGLNLNGDNAPYFVNQPQKLSLGDGIQAITPFLDLKLYSNSSRFFTAFMIAQKMYVSKKVSDSNQNELKIVKGYGLNGSIDLAYFLSRYSFGGGILVNAEKDTLIGDISQKDGYLSYNYRLHLNFGNLNHLESSAIVRPWELQITVGNTFLGNNADEVQKISLAASLYF